MKRNLKKGISMILVVGVLIATMSCTAFAAELRSSDQPVGYAEEGLKASDQLLDWLRTTDTKLGKALAKSDNTPTMPENYYENTRTKGKLEAKYTAPGRYKVSCFEEDSNSVRLKQYKVFYPTKMTRVDRKWPVVVMVNGTGVLAGRYSPVLKHMASWGFIVIGCQEQSSWDGKGGSKMLTYIEAANIDPDSPFYGKVDTERIGVVGHSQGGVGAINAATKYKNSNKFRCVVSESCTSPGLSENLKWDYDVTKLTVPTLFFAGTGIHDAGKDDSGEDGICPLPALLGNYNSVRNGKLTVCARYKGADHGDVLILPDGYVTAWFCYHLKGDKSAAGVFVGQSPELKHNKNYVNVKIKNS